ncbi:PAS domain-containing protein [Thermoflexibacter ruber]|uniref:PAS domain S-box-containing protein n=1 Tax=Thermoflexibacter ruber TaxID=1003 RepID=A0A1I2ABB3_9BACT|nr:PAS domain-containing protein [Thermoflexibacter ruber]SFE41037.1 PAS domain S-box-containing protein [Thermoflexibacter ruber]
MSKKNLDRMMCLDVFLMSLSLEERRALQAYIFSSTTSKHILECFDVASLSWQVRLDDNRDRQYLQKIALQMQWQNNLNEILQKPYEALVLTNAERVILWVNKGFETMTGYRTCEVLGKRPSFLQGKNTDPNTRLQFRQKLQEGKNFDLTIVNYRKNGEEYFCRVEIHPLTSPLGQISHYLALEQEI